MGSKELLNEFTLLYNNINSNAAPGLESFEISQLLTKAQGEKISNAFNPEGNKYKEGFDDSIKRQHDFSTIIKVQTLKSVSPTTKIDSRSLAFTPPDDLLFPINEILYIGDKVIQVFPISYNEYTLKSMKPYNEPYKRSAWRLVGLDGNIEVIPAYNDRKLITSDNTSYKMRYVKKPKPILLEDYTADGYSIEGVTGGTGYDFKSPCELPDSMQHEIVQRAVELAKAAYQPEEAQIQTQMGTRSE